MDAVEFLKATRRLCAIYHCENGCPLLDSCDDETDDGYTQKVRTVEQWAKEHPAKTRQSEFLKMFPNAVVMTGGVLCIRPCDVDNTIKNLCKTTNCGICRRDFWLKEIE